MVAAGQTRVKLTGMAVPPRDSTQLNVADADDAAVTQLPVIDAGETAPLPTAKGMLEMKPLNGAPGAVQVVVVMAAVPLPDPGEAIETPMARLPVLPMVDPPVAVTVPPAAGEYANCGGTGAAIGIE